ncbi:MAG: hypothetical protein WA364_22220 [Candidatus Nitrosopolaris sp.]
MVSASVSIRYWKQAKGLKEDTTAEYSCSIVVSLCYNRNPVLISFSARLEIPEIHDIQEIKGEYSGKDALASL